MSYAYKQPGSWSGLKTWVFKNKGRSCYLCGQLATQVDHVIPVSRGGTHAKENLAPICEPCHGIKSEHERRQGIERRKARKASLRNVEQHPNSRR